MEAIINKVISLLEQHSDPKRIKFAAASYPTSMKVMGVVNADLKEIIKALKAETKTFSPDQKIALAKSLVNTHIFECQFIAYEYLGKDKKTLNHITEKDLDDLAMNLDNWISVDGFGIYLFGTSWREGIIDDQKVINLLKSEDFWLRRLAIVSTISLNQKTHGGTGDAEKTLKVCKLAINDHQDMINKALSWALRELAKRDPEPVIAFVKEHEEQLHPRVYREVTKKLTTGRKN